MIPSFPFVPARGRASNGQKHAHPTVLIPFFFSLALISIVLFGTKCRVFLRVSCEFVSSTVGSRLIRAGVFVQRPTNNEMQ